MKFFWSKLIVSAICFGLIAGGICCVMMYAGSKMVSPSESESVLNDRVNMSVVQTAAPVDTASGMVSSVVDSAYNACVTVFVKDDTMSSETVIAGSSGTGVIIGETDTEYDIVTNRHVVDNKTSIQVGFYDNTAVYGTVKGTDEQNDLAAVVVLKSDIARETLQHLVVAKVNPEDVVLGQQVVAIGNAFGSGQSVTVGYVSALHRNAVVENGSELYDLIQTDAAINPGNSGGALLDMNGNLVGINVAKGTDSLSGDVVDGVGFSIPVARVFDEMTELLAGESRTAVDESQRGYLDVSVMSASGGLYVTKVAENGAAANAGICEGDVLEKLDNIVILSIETLQDIMKYYHAGDRVTVKYRHYNGTDYIEKTAEVVLSGNIGFSMGDLFW